VALRPRPALGLLTGRGGASAADGHQHVGEVGVRSYTENVFCFPRFCTNPIVPGLMQFGQNVLTRSLNRTWECQGHLAWQHASFCGRVVSGYHFAVPANTAGSPSLSPETRIAAQEKDAVTAYIAHMAGMGHDFWDFTEPWKHDDCVQAVWKMACYTHFPRCNQFNAGVYLRPCASSCKDYLKTCRVECCDEGAQCVFEHRKELADGSVVLEEGYVDQSGPSPMCTGAAAGRLPSGGALGLLLRTALLAATVTTAIDRKL